MQQSLHPSPVIPNLSRIARRVPMWTHQPKTPPKGITPHVRRHATRLGRPASDQWPQHAPQLFPAQHADEPGSCSTIWP
eukprot:6708345-Pyramimonas_sp.AAC.1